MNDEKKNAIERLQATMSTISRVIANWNQAGALSLQERRANIESAAQLLLELYGRDALDRARLIEERSPEPSFARSVRMTLEAMIRAQRHS